MNQDASTAKRPSSQDTAAKRRWIVLLTVLLVTVGGVLLYWRYAELYPSTDNAYTGANVVRVASQVSGPVARIYVAEDNKVAAGDPLFDIDATLYDAAIRNARAQFDAAANAAGTEREVSIVGADEVDLDRNYISWVSPLGRALLKASPGDSVMLHAPGGSEELQILDVRYERIPVQPFREPPGAESAPKQRPGIDS